MELKACPFCGKKVWLHYRSASAAFYVHHVSIDDAEACPVVEPFMLDGTSLADAADGWNTRAGEERAQDETAGGK